jgi:Fe2+ or Zn2+ uptake regulation protein
MKTYNTIVRQYQFKCDRCGEIISSNINEQEALKEARINADRLRWEWHHPHWGLVCNNCIVGRA